MKYHESEPDQFLLAFWDELLPMPAAAEASEVEVEVEDLRTGFVLTDAARELLLLNHTPAAEASSSPWHAPARTNALCAVCHFPTSEADGLCSQACRNAQGRGRRVMKISPVTGATHLRHVSGCGTQGGGGTGGAMARRFTADNQKLQLN